MRVTACSTTLGASRLTRKTCVDAKISRRLRADLDRELERRREKLGLLRNCARISRLAGQLQRLEDMPPEPSDFVVLLVDDDLRTTRRLADMLREDGLTVEVARNGLSAISRLTQGPMPDALVTELTTSLASGSVVSQFARSRRPGLAVFVVTGYPNLFDPEAFGVPAPVLFTKPVDYASLKDALLAAWSDKRASWRGKAAGAEDSGATVELESRAEDGRGNPVPGAQALRAVR